MLSFDVIDRLFGFFLANDDPGGIGRHGDCVPVVRDRLNGRPDLHDANLHGLRVLQYAEAIGYIAKRRHRRVAVDAYGMRSIASLLQAVEPICPNAMAPKVENT